jgi:hypothetical protein
MVMVSSDHSSDEDEDSIVYSPSSPAYSVNSGSDEDDLDEHDEDDDEEDDEVEEENFMGAGRCADCGGFHGHTEPVHSDMRGSDEGSYDSSASESSSGDDEPSHALHYHYNSIGAATRNAAAALSRTPAGLGVLLGSITVGMSMLPHVRLLVPGADAAVVPVQAPGNLRTAIQTQVVAKVGSLACMCHPLPPSHTHAHPSRRVISPYVRGPLPSQRLGRAAVAMRRSRGVDVPRS